VVTVLGLDTATTACSAAVWRGGAIAAARFEEMARGQAERLNPMIGEVMAAAGLAFADLDLLAVTVGPGAFTGLRIGLASARAIALAAGLPVRGVTTFAALARAVPEDELSGRELVVAVNGKRRDVLVQRFGPARTPAGPPMVLDPAGAPGALGAGRLLIAGDGAPLLRAALANRPDAGDRPGARIRFSRAVRPPDAVHVAALAAADGGDGTDAPPRPLYLRPPDTRRAPARGRPRP
jgi:tRNA threonylcarbamoyladenosine biosynthesis protein TsaB